MKMKSIYLGSLVISQLFFYQAPVSADEGLYPATPTKESITYRFFNATDNPIHLQLFKQQSLKLDGYSSSAYQFVNLPQLEIAVAGKDFDFAMPKGTRATFIWDGQTLTQMTEDNFDNKRKSRLKVFNLTKENISIKANHGKVEVINDIVPNQFGIRELNSVNVAFSIHDSDSQLSTEKIQFSNGKELSIFYLNNAGKDFYILAQGD